MSYQGCAEAGLCYPLMTKVLFPTLVGGATPEVASHRWEAVAIIGGFSVPGGRVGSRKGRTLQARMRDRGLRVAAAALVILVGIWAGIRVYSSWRAPARTGAIAIPVGRPAFQPRATSSTSRRRAWRDRCAGPERLPSFALRDLGGTLTPIDHFRGKSLVINFWATWCAPCRREIPMLGHLSTQWADGA